MARDRIIENKMKSKDQERHKAVEEGKTVKGHDT